MTTTPIPADDALRRWADCERKYVYVTWAEAQARVDTIEHDGRLRVYACPYDAHYHFGSTPKQPRSPHVERHKLRSKWRAAQRKASQ